MNKRIAIIASSIHPQRQKHLIDWYEDLKAVYPNCQLFIGSKNKAIPFARAYKLNTRLEKLKDRLIHLLKFKKRSPELRKIQPLVDYRPDIIHLLTSNAFPLVEPYIEEKHIKVIVSFRGYDINVFPRESEANFKMIKSIFQRSDLLHFISEGLKLQALKYGADAERAIVIRRSIRVLTSKTQVNKNQPVVILSVARLVWEKGFLYALEAVKIIKERGFNFIYLIAGEGIDRKMLDYHIRRLDLEDFVKFLGALDKDEVNEVMSQADIFFQPSLEEALSVSLIEASAHGLPVVASNIGGIPEVVVNGSTGYLSEVCKPEGFADSLEKLIIDSTLRQTFGLNARRKVKLEFNRDIEINSWLNVYSSFDN